MPVAARARSPVDSVSPGLSPFDDILAELLEASGSRWGRLTLEGPRAAIALACNMDVRDRGWAGWSGDPWRLQRPEARNQVVRGESFLSETFWRASELYLLLLRPAGIEPAHTLLATVDTARGPVVLFLARSPHDGPHEYQALDRVRRLLPGIARTTALCDGLEEAKRSAHHAQAALDALTVATISLDRHGQLVWRNRAADDLLATGGWLRTDRDRLATVRREDAAELDRALQAACDELQPRPSFLRLQDAEGAWASALVSPTLGGGALVSVRASGTRDDRFEPIRRLFGLTEAEALLAWALLNGETLADFAAARGVSVNTARVQLTSVMRKTRTRRQAELVALLGAIPPVRLPPSPPRAVGNR